MFVSNEPGHKHIIEELTQRSCSSKVQKKVGTAILQCHLKSICLQSNLPLQNTAILISESGKKEKEEEKTPKPTLLAALAFSQVSVLHSCRLSKCLFLLSLACPSHLLCLVAFSVLHLLIPTLRIRSPLPSPTTFECNNLQDEAL